MRIQLLRLSLDISLKCVIQMSLESIGSHTIGRYSRLWFSEYTEYSSKYEGVSIKSSSSE